MTISAADLDNLETNIKGADSWVGGASTGIAANGRTFDSIAKINAQAISDFDQHLATLGFEPPITFVASILVDRTTLTVEDSGNIFAPLVSEIPFTTTGTFNAAQWYIITDFLPSQATNAGKVLTTDATTSSWTSNYVAARATTVSMFTATDLPLNSLVRSEGFTTSNDGGGDIWKHNGVTGQTASQSPAQLGAALFNDGNGDQFALLGDIINARAVGYVGDGAADDRLSIIAAGASTKTMIIPGPSICNLSADAALDNDTNLIVDNNVTFVGAGNITGIGIADQSLMSKTSGIEGIFDDRVGTSIGKYITYRKSSTPSADSESDALLVIGVQEEDSSSFTADLVGIGGRAYIPGSNTNGRAWGMNAFVRITAPGDGLVHGLEVNVENGGTANAVPDSPLAKYGINITTKPGSNDCTAAIKIGSNSVWNFGLWAAPSAFVASTSKFIELSGLYSLNAEGRVAIGTTTHEEQLNVVKTSGRSQIVIESDGAGGEASTRYKDAGTRNWTAGHFFDTGRYTITTGSVLSADQVFEIDANGSFGFNGFSAGSGQGGLFIANAGVVPTTNPVGGGITYTEAGALKYRGSAGTVTQLAAA